MKHPFEKLLTKALRASTPEENLVLEEAEALRKKGYPVEEIHAALARLRDSYLGEQEVTHLTEATAEFESYL